MHRRLAGHLCSICCLAGPDQAWQVCEEPVSKALHDAGSWLGSIQHAAQDPAQCCRAWVMCTIIAAGRVWKGAMFAVVWLHTVFESSWHITDIICLHSHAGPACEHLLLQQRRSLWLHVDAASGYIVHSVWRIPWGCFPLEDSCSQPANASYFRHIAWQPCGLMSWNPRPASGMPRSSCGFTMRGSCSADDISAVMYASQ